MTQATHFRVCQRAKGQVVVNVFIAIEITKLAAAGLLYKNRPGIVGAVVAGDTQGNTLEIFLVGFGGFGRSPLKTGEFLR